MRFHHAAEHITAEHAPYSGPDVLERSSEQEGHNLPQAGAAGCEQFNHAQLQ